MYSSALDLFEAARSAAAEVLRVERMIEALKGAEQSRGSGEPVASGSISDPMARTDARIDLEAVWSRRLAESRALVAEAEAVLYGRNGRGGLASLADPVCADSIHWHYIMLRPWPEVAELVGYSASQVRLKALTGFDLIDAMGPEAVTDGAGIAEG